jgi:hypothetical protein
MQTSAKPGKLWKQLAWMAGIWLASVLTLAVVAATIRSWLKP